MFKTVLITGASSGIGKATAIALAKQSQTLILIGRREKRLKELCKEIGTDTKTIPVALDVTNAEKIDEFINTYKDDLENLEVLINSAGLAKGAGPFDETPPDFFDQMIDTNIKALIKVTRYLVPFLKKQEHSHIINLGSIAGRWVYPGGAVYCATKHAIN
ncbi:UNVERIFIED_CONTAM: hypothetical protein GTU68_024137 [Idotea baltica]|nr:hypothetical protein [Idotea baltica]